MDVFEEYLLVITHRCMMGGHMVHLLFAVFYPSTTIVCAGVRYEPTVFWNMEVSPVKASDLKIPVPIPDTINFCVPAVRTSQYSSKVTSSQPNVVVNINNFLCIAGTQEVNVDPVKSHIVNIAIGNQAINFPQSSEIAGTTPRTTKPIFEIPLVNFKETPRDFLPTREEQSRMTQNEYLNARTGLPKCNCDVLHRRVYELPQPLTIGAKQCQVKHVFCCNDGALVTKVKSSDNHHFPKTPNVAEPNYEWAPDLKLFIGGKRVNETQAPQITPHDQPSSNNWNEILGALLHDSGFTGIGRKSLFCGSEDYPMCNNEVIIFRDGFELTFDQFEKIFEEISDRPDLIKLIVPGGVTGPLLGYFQQLEINRHAQALQHGVCLLSNGFLVPIGPMLRVIQLHGWLSSLNPSLSRESFLLLHLSMWADMNSVLNMLQCLIKSGRVVVVLPSNQKIPFDQFERQEHHVSNILQEQMKVELFGVSVSYLVFKNSLLELCRSINTPSNS